jgi:4-aminobutyrate aminotransferase-like enzyme
MREGLLVFPAGVFQNVIRICPPLIVSKEEVETALEILEHAIREGSDSK